MGLTVTVAPRPELLLDDLAERLRRPLPDPFDEDVVVVPTTGIRNWLRAELAVRLGIVVRVRFVLPGALPDVVLGAGETDEAWRVDRLAWQVLGRVVAPGGVLSDPPWSRSPARPWTVAARIAGLLDHYAAQRPGMLAAWARGEDRSGPERDAPPLPAAQRWQAEAWRALVAAMPGPAPALRVATALDGATTVAHALPPRLTLVGPGSVTDHALGLILHAADRTDVAVLGVVHRDPAGEPPLAAWGRRAEEVADAIERLARAPGVPAPTRRSAPRATPDQLGQLRGALAAAPGVLPIEPRPPVPTSRRRGDGSVIVHACHGPVRQLEVARDAILHALEDDHELLPRDVLVLCGDIATVAPLVQPVLGAPIDRADGRTRRLAVEVVDRSVRGVDVVRATLDLALAAVADRLTREDVESLLAMPPVRATLGLDLDELGTIGELFAELGTRWGVDAEHRRRWEPGRTDDDARDDGDDDGDADGDDPRDGALRDAPGDVPGDAPGDEPGDGTWRDARDRIAAGLLLHPTQHRVVATGDGLLAPARLAADSTLAGAAAVAEALDAVMSLARRSGRAAPVTVWARATQRLVRSLMRPTGRGAESTAWRADADRILDTVDAIVADAAAGAADEVPLTLREWSRSLAGRLDPGGGGVVPSAGRVQVGSLGALRGVPARLIVLVGLDDAATGATRADADDALAGDRRPGERDPGAEARASLLEAVVAAQDRLIVTCDGRSITTGEELPLPTVVEELCDALPDVPDGASPLVVVHPRHLSDPRALGLPRGGEEPVRPPSGRGPWTFLRSALTMLDPDVADAPPVLGTSRLVVREAGTALEVVDPHAGGGRADAAWIDLDLAEVAAALRGPGGTYLRTQLDVDVPEPEGTPARQVPLDVEPLEEAELGRELMRAAGTGDEDAWRRLRPARGGLPPGRLGEDLLARIAAEVAGLRDLAPVRREPDVLGVEVRLVPRLPIGGGVDLLAGDPRRVRLTAALPAEDRRFVDVAFVTDHPREHVAAWLHLLVAAHVDPEDPWLREAVVVRRPGRALSGKEVKRPARHVMRMRGEDATERAALAADALAALVGLAVLVREVPVPLLPRASWLLAGEKVAAGNIAKDIRRDAYDAGTRLLLGEPTQDELARMAVRIGAGSLTGRDVSLLLRDMLARSVVVETTLGDAA